LGRVSTIGHNWYDDHVVLGYDPEYQPEETAGMPPPETAFQTDRPEAANGPRRAAVITVFHPTTPPEVVSAQAEVIRRFLPPDCEFEPVAASDRARGLDDYFHTPRHEAYLIFDVDCIPLADWVIPWFLENALAGIVLGPAQRSNHLENGGHVFAGTSALAFSRNTFERLGRVSFGATPRGDVGEELTYACERVGVPVCLLWPTHVVRKTRPLRFDLSLGVGVTFAAAVYNACDLSCDHAVGSFLEQCRRVLKLPPAAGTPLTFPAPSKKDATAECPAAKPRPSGGNDVVAIERGGVKQPEPMNLERIYSRKYYNRMKANSGMSAAVVVPALIARENPRSVVDVGCGIGTWLAEFTKAGIDDVLGIDGPWVPQDLLRIPAARFLVHDLREPLRIGRTFDLVVCLEVAEHLPVTAAEVLVHGLTQLGNVVLFSAAPPGQGGECHVNERPTEWWARLFVNRGFQLSIHFGQQFKGKSNVAWWYSRNMVFFTRTGAHAMPSVERGLET
jgi:SAM-dependent methyltransferase